MKQKAMLAVVCLLLFAALVATEVRKVDAPVGPQAIVYFIADTQRELTRLPMVYTRIPDEQEIAIGKNMAGNYGMEGRRGGAESAEIEKYIARVGASLARHAERKLPYTFHYVPSMEFVNAFALPGGPVFIGAGLLLRMESEDELAAILGHEIEHIDHYHCAERLQWEAALRKIPLGRAFTMPAMVFQAGYTKEQEFEADAEGTRLAMAAGYSPRGAIRAFEEFERLQKELERQDGGPPRRTARRAKTPQEEMSRVASDLLRGYFQSHPATSDRKARLQQMFSVEIAARDKLRPFEYAYVFLTYRAGQAFEMAKDGDIRRRETKEKLDQALKLGRESLALKPGQPQALRTVGLVELARGNVAAAREIYYNLVENHPEHGEAIRGYAEELANRAFQAKDYKRAAALVNFVLALQPNHPAGLQMLGQVHLAQGNLNEAQPVALRLRSLYPANTHALAAFAVRLGREARAEREYGKSVRLMELALRLDESVAMRKELADTLFAQGDFNRAAENYRKVLQRRNPDAELMQLYAESLSESGRGAEAVREFQEWLERVSPSDGNLANQGRIELAGLQIILGDRSVAEQMRRLAAPGSVVYAPENLGRLARWFARAADGRTALEIAKNAAGQRPSFAELQKELGWAHLEMREYVQAEAAFQRSASLSGREMASHTGNSRLIGLALALWGQARSREAMESFNSGIEQHPQWLNLLWVGAINSEAIAAAVAEIHDSRRAHDRFFAADFAAAAAITGKFAQKYPGDPAWPRRHSNALSAMGNPAKAVGEFESLLKKAPPAGAARDEAELDLAGLKLLAGETQAIESWRLAMQAARRMSPEWAVRLAWWHFRAGKTPQEVENELRAQAQLAQGEARVQSALGWLEIERGNYRVAAERFAKAAHITREEPGAAYAIGQAVALWRTAETERERALDIYEAKAGGSPYWRNAAYVKALTPPGVAATVLELEAALQKREEKEQASAPQ